MKTLFAGPFVGEFGWELFGWQSYIRKMSEDYERTIVSSRPGHEFLYEDFMDEYVSYDPKKSDCAGWTCYGHTYKNEIHKKFEPTKHLYIDEDSKGQSFIKKNEQKFVKYKFENSKHDIDIVINARKINSKDDYKNSRNYPIDRWNKIVSFLNSSNYKIASIGRPGGSVHIDGTRNMIGITLKELAEVLSSSKIMIGPSSGPMHFATLCGCPHLVWTPSFNRERYMTKWNPFNTPVKVFDSEGWMPEPASVEREVSDFMRTLYYE